MFLWSPCFCAVSREFRMPTVLRFTVAALTIGSESYYSFLTFLGDVLNCALNASRFVMVGSLSIILSAS